MIVIKQSDDCDYEEEEDRENEAVDDDDDDDDAYYCDYYHYGLGWCGRVLLWTFSLSMLDSEHQHHPCLLRSFIWIPHVHRHLKMEGSRWSWIAMRRQDKDPLASFLPSIFNWRPYWVPRPLDTEQFSPEFFQKVMLSSCVRFITPM